MQNFFAYMGLGAAVLGSSLALLSQFKNPSTLDPSLVWNEVLPVLNMISMATGTNINLVLAQKITQDAVQTVLNYVPVAK